MVLKKKLSVAVTGQKLSTISKWLKSRHLDCIVTRHKSKYLGWPIRTTQIYRNYWISNIYLESFERFPWLITMHLHQSAGPYWSHLRCCQNFMILSIITCILTKNPDYTIKAKSISISGLFWNTVSCYYAK